jgi:hypothetical protein
MLRTGTLVFVLVVTQSPCRSAAARTKLRCGPHRSVNPASPRVHASWFIFPRFSMFSDTRVVALPGSGRAAEGGEIPSGVLSAQPSTGTRVELGSTPSDADSGHVVHRVEHTPRQTHKQ